MLDCAIFIEQLEKIEKILCVNYPKTTEWISLRFGMNTYLPCRSNLRYAKLPSRAPYPPIPPPCSKKAIKYSVISLVAYKYWLK